jgi:hypothetical protein
MVVPEADIIPPLVRQQAGTIQPIREDEEPCTCGTVPIIPSCHKKVVPAAAVKEELLGVKPGFPCRLSGLGGAVAMRPKVEPGPGTYEGYRQVASCRK